MRFTILSNLDSSYKDRWQKQFVAADREYLESIWRRSERVEFKDENSIERRRRMIHIIDKYDMVPNEDGTYDFVIAENYLWLCSTLPRDEVQRYIVRFTAALQQGGWHQEGGVWKLDGQVFSYVITDRHPEDIKVAREFGDEYQTIECTLQSDNFPENRKAMESPWAVFNTGERTPGSRVDNPTTITDMKDILQYLPAQIELGGGASLELGIPPLNYFHTVYNLYTKDDKRLAYGDTDFLLDEILADPVPFYTKKAALPYARAFTVEPNNFYKLMSKLHQEGKIVGKVVTNNFDGICSLVGLDEMYVRKYDEAHIVPEVDFAPEATSLLVIGSHADRRRVQQAAKAKGLKIIYVDPESYVNHQGNHIDYPLEKIEADDILVPYAAGTFAEKLEEALKEQPQPRE